MNMKMKNTKQRGAAVLIKNAAALIAAAVLFASCTGLDGGSSETASASAEGKAVVTLAAATPARTIITGVNLESYTYTLKGTVSGGTKQTLLEGKSYADFTASGALLVDPGAWSFTAEAYSGTTKVLSGTTSADLSAGAATISFTLRAVAVSGGHSTVNVTLQYPKDKGVAKVTAALYSSPVAADSGTELTLTAGATYDSAAFSSSAVTPAAEQYVRFFLYDDKDVCIGVYTESVYAVSGCTATVACTLENINMFAVTVTVYKNGAVWTDSGKSVILKKGNVSYTLTAATGEATYTASVPNGTYAVYSGVSGSEANTSVTVTAKTDGTAAAAVDYYSVTYDGNGNTGGTVPGEQIWLKGAAATITIAANSFERTGYSFNGWNTATGTAYAAGDTYSTDAALTLYAQWKVNTYTVTLDNQSATTAGTAAIYEKYGSGYYTDSTASTKKMTATENPITAPVKTGYSFGGYYTGTGGAGTQYIDAAGNITASADATNFTAAGTLYAKWKSSEKQLLTFGFTNSANSAFVVDETTGTIDQSAHTVAVIVPYGTTVTALVATFTCSDKASVTVGSNAQTSGTTDNDFTNAVTYTVTAEDGSTQTYAVTVTVDLFCEKIWYLSSGTDGSNGTTDSYVWFGVWPQTIIASSGVTSTTTTMGGATYYKGSDGYWYAKVTAKTYNNATNYTFTDGTTVTSSTEYYFKVEPIKWRVLETGKLLAESILANVAYYPYQSVNRTIDDKTVYPNNYQHSRIRAYLNGLSYYQQPSSGGDMSTNTEFEDKGFLQTAFTATAKEKIATTNVDNSGASTTDARGKLIKADGTNSSYPTNYTCDNTSDKIYLLSELEVTDSTAYHFGTYDQTGTSTLRLRTVSDYARATGAYMYTTAGDYQYRGWWWLRSPVYFRSSVAFDVGYYGYADDGNYVSDTHGGVVPALSITQ